MPSSTHRLARLVIPAVLAAGWLALAGLAAADTIPRPPSPTAAQSAGFVGQETCLTCHEDRGKAFGQTAHARAWNPRTPAAAGGCESCHGPGQAHVEGAGDATKITRFAGLSPEAVNESCTTCHNRDEHAQWDASPHASRNLSCLSCHSVHEPKSENGQLKTASETETCATCHRDKAAKLRRTAHMPVREGKMECSTCHNPHGSTNVRLLRAGNSVNESCTSCHAEKRGPFLWEHAAVRENCTSCHDPHGSSNDRMLVAKAPMLCQRCHAHTRHPGTIYDAVALRGGSGNRIYGRSCVTCHSNIHGSNAASGNTFLR